MSSPPCTNVNPPAKTQSPPIDHFLATVLGRHLSPGAAFWGRKLRLECNVTITKCQMSAGASNCDLQNVECQSLIPSWKISSRSPRFAKGAITNLSDVLKRRLCLQHPAPAYGLTDGCVTMLSDSQACELSHFVLILYCVTMDENPAFTVHATVRAFRAAINLKSMLLRQQIWSLRNYLIFDGLTNFMFEWIWCGSEGNYDDFYLWQPLD